MSNEPEEMRVVREALLSLGRTALATIDPDALAKFRETLERADAFGPILDPTAWMKSRIPRERLADLASATAVYYRTVEELFDAEASLR